MGKFFTDIPQSFAGPETCHFSWGVSLGATFIAAVRAQSKGEPGPRINPISFGENH